MALISIYVNYPIFYFSLKEIMKDSVRKNEVKLDKKNSILIIFCLFVIVLF